MNIAPEMLKKYALIAVPTGFLVGAALYLTSPAMADGIPEDTPLTYAGVLEDDGQPVNGTRNFRLTVYDDANSTEFDDLKCSTQASDIEVTDGNFRVPLSNSCVQAVRNNSNLWIEVEVDGQVVGRTKMGAVPYAVEAQRAASLTDSARDSLVPPGTVVAYAGPESTIPEGWLLADGSELKRDDFPRLYAAIRSAHGNGDGTSTFHLPDYRGVFLRGVDGGRGKDPNASGRTAAKDGGNTGDKVGSLQEDSIGDHRHDMKHRHTMNHTHKAGNLMARIHIGETGWISSDSVEAVNERGGHWDTTRRASGLSMKSNDNWDYGTVVAGSTAGPSTTQTGEFQGTTGFTKDESSESRPANAYVNYIIKY